MLASINPHYPWTAGDPTQFNENELVLPPYWIDTPETRKNYAKYLAEVSVLDQEVGDIVNVLKEKNQLDNTLIIFVSEQGSKFPGAKWNVWNAGTKSAMIASWKGTIATGSETEALVQYEDILPTIIDIAGGETPEHMDGISFYGLLQKKTDHHREYVYGVHHNLPEGSPYPIRSISDGTHKLIWNLVPHLKYSVNSVEKDESYISWQKVDSKEAAFILQRYQYRPEFEFYNIVEDIHELNNLAADPQYADKMIEMKKVLEEWMEAQGDEGAIMDSPLKPGQPTISEKIEEDISSQRWLDALSKEITLPEKGGNQSLPNGAEILEYTLQGAILHLDDNTQNAGCTEDSHEKHQYAFRFKNENTSYLELPTVENAGELTLHIRNGNASASTALTLQYFDITSFEWQDISPLVVAGNQLYHSQDEVIRYNVDRTMKSKLRITGGDKYVQLYKFSLDNYKTNLITQYPKEEIRVIGKQIFLSDSQQGTLTLIDVVGKNRFQIPILNPTINLPDYVESGVYILYLEERNNSVKKKVFIQ